MNHPNKIISPVTGKDNCEKVKSFSTQPIINSYKNDLYIDVEEYFQNIESIDLYKCKESGLRFFIPDIVQGDGDFYKQLQKYNWYYLPLKWEHKRTIKHLPKKGKLLEIGCAEGAFLKIAQKNGMEVEGIELNQNAAEKARNEGLKVHSQLLTDFLLANKREKFDVVCAYQVLEHISNVKQFLEEAITCLKPGGLLFISVPNMDSFLKYDDGGILNFPPHHQGWYTPNVMKKIADIFLMDLVEVSSENLQKEHFNWFHKSMIKKLYTKNRIIGSIYFRITLISGIKNILIKIIAPFMNGHSMMAIYRKK